MLPNALDPRPQGETRPSVVPAAATTETCGKPLPRAHTCNQCLRLHADSVASNARFAAFRLLKTQRRMNIGKVREITVLKVCSTALARIEMQSSRTSARTQQHPELRLRATASLPSRGRPHVLRCPAEILDLAQVATPDARQGASSPSQPLGYLSSFQAFQFCCRSGQWHTFTVKDDGDRRYCVAVCVPSIC